MNPLDSQLFFLLPTLGIVAVAVVILLLEQLDGWLQDALKHRRLEHDLNRLWDDPVTEESLGTVVRLFDQEHETV